MPYPETSHRLQPALVWFLTGFDGYGQHTVATTPVEIMVRWDGSSSQVLDKQGNNISLDATAFTNIDIAIGSKMRLGSLADWVGTGSSIQDNEIMEVKTFSATPDLKNRISTRKVGLMRFRSELP